MRILGMIAALFVLTAVPAGSHFEARAGAQDGQPDLTGEWTGAIAVSGVSLRIRVVFQPSADGLSAAIDIPQQGASGLPLRNVAQDGAAVGFELPAGPGVARFEGTRSGDTITGTFTQGGAAGNFSLTRTGDVVAEPPPPYPVEPAQISNGDVTLSGTLTLPEGAGPFPAVVLVSGSGAQNRDEEIAGFAVFRVLADHLTRHGIAVLRYDDRGVGESTGSVARSTTEDFSRDALAALALLRSRPEIDTGRVGIIGHSEGGAVAALAALAPIGGPSFIVMLAGTGVPGAAVTYQQAGDAARMLGATDEQLARILAAHERMTALVAADAPRDAVVEAVRDLMRAQIEGRPAAQAAAVGNIDAFIDARLEATVAGILSPWTRYFLTFDPATALTQVRCPVLAIFGGRDTQVPPALHRPAVERALVDNPRATIREYPTANHLFQAATTGLVTEYAALDKSFVPDLLDDLSAWILEASAAP